MQEGQIFYDDNDKDIYIHLYFFTFCNFGSCQIIIVLSHIHHTCALLHGQYGCWLPVLAGLLVGFDAHTFMIWLTSLTNCKICLLCMFKQYYLVIECKIFKYLKCELRHEYSPT